MEIGLLYKLILFAIGIVTLFFYQTKQYRHRIQTGIFTASGLMTILCFNIWGFFGLLPVIAALGGGLCLNWTYHNGKPHLSTLWSKLFRRKT